MIAGTNSGCGKTTVALGLMAALNRKMKVQPYKVGPDYIDPAFHTAITGRDSSNLDSWILPKEEVKNIFVKNSSDADISIIEGVMGMHDGFGIEKDSGSSSHVAKILNVPVIIVLNAKAMALSAAALVKGFAEFDPEVNVAGVIVNNVMGERHYRLLKDSIENHTKIKVLGYLPTNKNFGLSSRHLGLIPSYEVEDLLKKINLIGDEIEKYIDLEEIIKTSQVNWNENKTYIPEEKIAEDVNIAIAFDKAFNFYYKDSLQLLEEYGANIVKFSPINDTELPENIDGLYFGGGFPEMFSTELEANNSIKKSIIERLKNGIPYLAECGGLMYLSRKLINFDKTENWMTGWFDFDCEMTERLQRFGYQEIKLKSDSILGASGSKIRAHEFHRSKITGELSDTLYAIEKKNHYECKKWECGFIKGNGIAGYPHLHFRGNKSFAKSFIKSAEKYRKQRCNI